MENEQLRLMNSSSKWQIDEHTKEVGRRGLAQARAALAQAQARCAERDERLRRRPRRSAA